MKKTLSKIIIAVLALCLMLSAVACGGSSWKWDASKVTLKPENAGALISAGGFIAETENYVYYVNGAGDSTADNTMGKPVKGALYAAKKSDLSETCVVVPKLFVASDYNAGIYIFGEYVYYGTPSTEKNSSGSIASNELVFAKTKLDGTGTETFFTADSLSVEYRIIEIGGIVYIVYYDGTDSLISYNTSTKESIVIAKTDVKAKNESLGTYKFVSGGAEKDLTVLYTVTIYSEPYYEELAEEQGSNYQRASKSYNRVYAYKPGDSKADDSDCYGVKVLDGEGVGGNAKTYAISLVNNGYVFYTETDGMNIVKNYAIDANGLHTGAQATVITDTTYASESSYIVSLSEVYALENSMIIKTTLDGETTLVKKTLADGATVSKLLFKNGDYMYFYNSDNKIARICISEDINARSDVDMEVQLVSEDTVDTAWYAPEIIDNKIFYLDNSASGASYVKYVAVNGTVKTETDDDDKITKAYLEGHEFLGELLDEDKATIVTAEIQALATTYATTVDFDKDDDDNVKLTDGAPTVKAVADARASYNALSKEAKEFVSEETLATLEKYETATELAILMYKLNDFDSLDNTAKTALQSAYNAVKAKLDAIDADKDLDVATIRQMMPTNMNFFYQEATEFFKAK